MRTIPDSAFCINLKERGDRWDQFIQQKLPFPVERFEAIKDSIGWVGCRASYLAVLKKTSGLSFIMEDDCEFLFDWSFIESIMEQLPADWDCLYLGATLNETLNRYSENLYCLQKGWTTHAILFNGRKVPDFILSHEKDIRKIDVFMANHVQPKFNCFITYPMTATQRASYSDIIRHFQDYSVIKQRYEMYVK